jgi:hypothetical protein
MFDGLVASASILPTILVAALTTLSRMPVASAIALCTCWRTLDIIAAWPKSGATVLNELEVGAGLARSAPCEATSPAMFDPPLIIADATPVTSPNKLPIGAIALNSVFDLGIASRTDLWGTGSVGVTKNPSWVQTHFHGRSNVIVDPSLLLSLTPSLRITKSFRPSPKDTTARTDSKMRMTMAVIGFAKRRWHCMIVRDEPICREKGTSVVDAN